MQLSIKVIKTWLPPISTSTPPFQGYPHFLANPPVLNKGRGGFQICIAPELEWDLQSYNWFEQCRRYFYCFICVIFIFCNWISLFSRKKAWKLHLQKYFSAFCYLGILSMVFPCFLVMVFMYLPLFRQRYFYHFVYIIFIFCNWIRLFLRKFQNFIYRNILVHFIPWAFCIVSCFVMYLSLFRQHLICRAMSCNQINQDIMLFGFTKKFALYTNLLFHNIVFLDNQMQQTFKFTNRRIWWTFIRSFC